MTKTLYLHCGMHKTGTTALQVFFQVNRERFKRLGLCYPATGMHEKGGHHLLASALKGNIRKRGVYTAKHNFSKYVQKLTEETAPYETILLSSEMFESIESDELFSLKQLAENIKVILYLRRQDLYLESLYSTYVKGRGYKKKISEFLNEMDVSYSDLCDKWAGYFGKGNLIVRIYDNSRFKGGDLFSDFLSILGIKMDDNFWIPPQKINPSLGIEELEYMRMINCLQLTKSVKEKIVKCLVELTLRRDCDNKRRLLTNSDVMNLNKKYTKENMHIASTYFNHKTDKLFSDALPISADSVNKKDIDFKALSRFVFKRTKFVQYTVLKAIILGYFSERESTKYAAFLLSDIFARYSPVRLLFFLRKSHHIQKKRRCKKNNL